MTAGARPTSLHRALAGLLLGVTLLLLAFRLTAAETLRDSLSQKFADAAQRALPAGEALESAPTVGPVDIAWYSGIAWLLAGAATWLSISACGGLPRFRLGQLAAILGLVALLFASAMQAANRFNALVGLADVITGLAAAWTVLLLCRAKLLGARGRQAVIAAVVAILMLGTAKALLQHFIEIPETIDMVKQNPARALRQSGIDPDDPVQVTLFMARLKSAEVSGFGGLSNVFATQMIPFLALLAALGVAGLILRQSDSAAIPEPPDKRIARRKSAPAPGIGQKSPDAVQIPMHAIALAAVAILLAAGLGVAPLTGSKGGLLAALLVLGVVIVGGLCWQWVAAHRRILLAAAGILAVLFPMVVVGWGLTHNGLPSKSLLFRWQYWRGTMPMIQEHPVWGVGLYNFGDYYPRFKLPESPEDVKDPHSFFVRFAAEAGLPALLAVALLLLLLLRGAFTGGPPLERPTADAAPGTGLKSVLLAGGLGWAAWVPLHFLAEAFNAYTIQETLLMAAAAWSVFAAVMALFQVLKPQGTRYVALAAVIAALGMLLYDQVNMALVTGPVAMLFWVLLATGDNLGERNGDRDDAAAPPTRFQKSCGLAAAALPTGIGLALVALLALPLSTGNFPPDPAPYEFAYIDQAQKNNPQAALQALDKALERSPNSLELLLQRIRLKRTVLHEPVADDIRRVLALDRANASVRLMVALPDSDLPTAERRKALEDALQLDQKLDRDEPKRLTDGQIKEVRETLARLQ